MKEQTKILLDNLTPEELERVVASEEREIFRRITVKGEAIIPRLMKKYKPMGEYMFKELHSTTGESGLEYKFFFYTYGYKDYKEKGFLFTLYIPYLTPSGFGALLSVNIEKAHLRGRSSEYIYFIPHFFNRYAEREHLEGLSKLEVIEHYFRRSNLSKNLPYPVEKYPNNIIAPLNGGGIALGTMEEGKLITYKTYLSKEEFKGEEQEGLHAKYLPYNRGEDYKL